MVQTANSDIVLLFLLFLLAVPVAAAASENSTTSVNSAGDPALQAPYSIRLFIPSARMIHSNQINDLISGPQKETIIGTSFGLSTYNGSWSTRHTNLNNISEGLMDDYITAIELDPDGNLWIGYSGGLQIFDGRSFRSIRDQQLLKNTLIRDIQRWNNDMWIATGHAGIHRYRSGTWTWYQPMTPQGPGFYEVRSMALDANHDVLVIATEGEGLWAVLPQPDDRFVFKVIEPRNNPYGSLKQVTQDPRGAVYISNESLIVRYDPGQGIIPVLTTTDLAPGDMAINDLAAAPDGRLFIATDRGIFIWKDGSVVDHLSRFEGIGTSPVVRTVTIDANNRVWFSTTGYVGFLEDRTVSAPTIAVEMMTRAADTTNTPAPAPATMPPPATTLPVVSPDQPPFFDEDSVFRFLNPIIDPLAKAINSIGSRS